MSCACDTYGHLELYREEIDRRIRATKRLKATLEVLAEGGAGDQLLKCAACGQHWQSSRAWNWGAREYLFKVPDIGAEEWLAEPYMKPDEMLIYGASMSRFEESQSFKEKDEACRAEGCDGRAIELSVLCKRHHVESLQKVWALPQYPRGRPFEPYGDGYT